MINRAQNSAASFKGVPKPVGNFAKSIDFADSNTSRGAVMWLYSGCILARLASSRDKYEFKETLVRDSIGWTSLFFASMMSEKLFAWAFEKISDRKPNDVNIFKGPNMAKFPSLIEVFSKKSRIKLRTFVDIKHGIQCNDALKKSIMRNKSLAYVTSIGFAVAVLGIFIPWLNVKTTRSQVKNQKGSKPNTIVQQQSHAQICMNNFLKNASDKARLGS